MNSYNEKLFELKQIPTPENPQAIVIATLQDEKGKRQGIGVAENYSSGSRYDPGTLINQASQKALAHAAKENLPIISSANKGLTETPYKTHANAKTEEKTWNHNSASGSISPKQLGMLKKIAQERGKDLAAMTQKMFDTSPDQLSSAQVQDMIKTLKAKGARL